MATFASFQVQVASIMDVLSKRAGAEIIKLVDEASAALRFEMCRSQRENEALKTKLLLMEGELRAVRGYGEGTPDNSVNIPFEVQVCEEFKEARIHGEQDWSESLLLSEDRLEEDTKSSQSQVEQKISEENTCGTSGAAAANGGEGPLCKEEEMHMQPCPGGDPEKGLQAELIQEPEEQPLTPTLPLLESVDFGLELQSVWREANGSGMALEKRGHRGGNSEHGHTKLDNDFSPRHYRGFWRLRLEKDEDPASHIEQQQNGHPLMEKRIICELCGKFFDRAHSLKQHCLAHHREKLFSCALCSKSFAKKGQFRSHQSVHTGERLHHCNKCGKSFAHQSNLKSHQSVHTGEKPHQCNECGKSFAHLWNLKTHQRVHTGEKPFSCTLCSRGFSQNHTLQRHILTHSQ